LNVQEEYTNYNSLNDEDEDQQFLFLLKRFLKPILKEKKPEFIVIQCDVNRFEISLECMATIFKELKEFTK
jgi:acetoin utilization deacetylase AcuC-like enzyme